MPELKKYQKYMAGFSKTQIALMILLAVSLLYISKGTSPIPNYVNGTLLYGVDAMVPKSYFSNNQLWYIYLLIGALVVTFVGKEAKKAERISIEEAKEIMENYLKKVKSIRTKTGLLIEIGDYHIDSTFLVKDIMIKNELKPYKYVLQIRITSEDKPTTYIKGYIDPFTRYIDGFLEIDEPLGSKDKCSDCGKEYDFKFIDSEDYKAFKKIKEDLKD